MARKRKRRSRYKDFEIENPCDGMEVNNFNCNMFVAKKSYSMSMFDQDNICIDMGPDQSRFKLVSIMKKVRRVNRTKTLKINGYKKLTNGRE